MASEHQLHLMIASWVSSFSYPAVLALLVACGLGAPLSEELIIISAGIVVAHGHGNLGLMILTAYCGTLAGDLTLFRIGRRVGPRALANKRVKKLLTPERVAWIEGHFKRSGARTLFAARFLPGLRAATFLVAGVSRFQTRRFLLADGAAALISAPLLTWLGFRFGLAVLKDVKQASRWILLGVGVLLLVLMVRKMIKRRRRIEAGEPEVAAQMVRREIEESSR